MPRVKRGSTRSQKRKKVLIHTKGFKWRRKNVYRIAIDAMRHALMRSYVGRKEKKRTRRALWQTNINAAVRNEGMNYSTFIYKLKQNNIEIDRKILAQIAKEQPQTFKEIVEKVK
ncbi:MAG: 50S ribosomal protein L20 [Candidatus Spechtbacteria bacterium SB0662_bin_43]|uniref:Large ribosomal subunit protein bL20 n=1 Tax=Candidatus Spechtbacteria bacterium SB0662_bin_43 TaxID=2604897 RepID=A0A845DMK7_9BACT|nr:50S ribosomal protein L20 [Candidatus Spechtbacteria bacterium SB0662_bin_43]